MRRLWRRLLRLLAQSRIVLPRRALHPEDLRPGDRLEIGEAVFRVRGALRLRSGPWAFRLEELDGTEPRPIRLLAVPESPGPWTLIRDGRWVEVLGECVRWWPVGEGAVRDEELQLPPFPARMPRSLCTCQGGAVAEHDGGYKRLFSHPEMVADLLRDFIREDWVRELDLATLEKVRGSYVTLERRSRESDVVWRVRWGSDHQLYVYLLIELQSTVNALMALRMMVYLGLLYQDLNKRRESTRAGKLPPVLPLVLYNGYAPWSAAQDISELIEDVPGGMERYRPRLRYCLLDEMRIGRLRVGVVAQPGGGAVPAGEKPGSVGPPAGLGGADRVVVGAGSRRAEESFALYLVKSLLPARVSGIEIPEANDLQEVKSMLAERAMDWTQQWKQEGLEEGRQEGLREGRQEALDKVRAVLVREFERRFGPLPEKVR